MIGIGFPVVFFFAAAIFVFVFFNVIRTFAGHRKLMNRVTDEVFRQFDDARDREDGPAAASSSPMSSGDYSCSKCGASLGSDTEISPSGDFKCEYCNSWSNVNQ